VTQARAGETLQLLQRPVKDMMADKHGTISNALLRLRSSVDEINPNNFFKRGGLSNLFHKILGSNPITNYIRKYESVETHIRNTIEALRHGRDVLEEDSIELLQLQKKARQQIEELEKRILLGNYLLQRLEEERARTSE